MKIPGFDKAYQRALDWGLRGDGQELFDDVLNAHIAGARRVLDVPAEDFADSLTGALGDMALAAAFADFLTYPSGADGESPIGNYLRRRGWKESAPRKAALKAFERSVMSLYEVVELPPSRGAVVRDMVRGGNPITVPDLVAPAGTAEGTCLGLRLFQVKGRHHAAPGILPFSGAGASAALAALSKVLDEYDATPSAEPSSSQPAPPLADTESLRNLAPIFTNVWLIDIDSFEWRAHYVFRDVLTGLSVARVVFPIEGDIEEAEAALAGLPGLSRVEGGYLWCGEATDGDHPDDADPDGGSRPPLGVINRTDQGDLEMTVFPADLAGEAIDLMRDALGGRAGKPTVILETGDQLLDLAPDEPLERASVVMQAAE